MDRSYDSDRSIGSRTSFADDDSEIGLSGIPLSAITRNLFDFSSQRRPSMSRINTPMFILVVFSVCCVVFAMVTGTSIEQESVITMEAGETRLVSNFSPLLASKLIISHHTPSVKVYHIKSSILPKLQLESIPYGESNQLVVQAASVFSQSHFLNEDSSTTLFYSSMRGMKFYVFEGTSNYKNWLEDIVPRTWTISLFSDRNSVQSIHLKIKHSNAYYFVFKNENEAFDADLSFNITLRRAEYVLDKKTPLCEVYYISVYRIFTKLNAIHFIGFSTKVCD
jgi:hypothetical protein